jgi:hypothetical protein
MWNVSCAQLYGRAAPIVDDLQRHTLDKAEVVVIVVVPYSNLWNGRVPGQDRGSGAR